MIWVKCGRNKSRGGKTQLGMVYALHVHSAKGRGQSKAFAESLTRKGTFQEWKVVNPSMLRFFEGYLN